MGQAEILKVLKKDKWMKSSEIAKKLNQSQSTTSLSLNKLLRQEEVLVRNYKVFKGGYGHEWKLK